MRRGPRFVSVLLVLALCFGCLPMAALAETETGETEPEAAAEELNTETAPPAGTEPPEEAPAETEAPRPTETPAPEETVSPAEETPLPEAEPEGGAAPEEEIYSVVTMEPETVSAGPDEYPDNDELFAGYVDEVMGMSTAAAYASLTTGDRLTGLTKAVYDALGDCIRQVAAGERASTTFTFSLADLRLAASNRWTAADLGVSAVTAVNSEGKRYITAEAAAKALGDEHSWDLSLLLGALLADYSYELYWFDKTIGIGSTSVLYAVLEGDEYVLYPSTELTLYMYAAKEYSLAGTTGTLTVDTTVGGSVSAAAENAAAIVSKYRGASDCTKLAAYRDEICDLTSYNHDAASGGADYGNPWQLIWVFDGDETTEVVCEGYSKAFRYLCDMTLFDSDKIYCYTVTGTLVGAGLHMWNIVAMDDGKNYLADITNCDAGHTDLFLAPASGSVADGYTCACGCDSGSHTYTYGSSQSTVYTEAELTLSDTAYARPGSAAAEDDVFTYRITGSAAAVTGYTGTETAIEIPAAMTLEGTEYPVTAIDDYAFQNNTALVSVVIPESVTSIGLAAFAGCTALETAALPAGLITLGGYAFDNTHLTKVTVPATLKTMGEAAFYRCNYLTELTLSDGLAAISDYAFMSCIRLTAADIPDTVTSVGKYAFAQCTGLVNIGFSSGVTVIGEYTFYECVSLVTLTVPNTVTAIKRYAFYNCYSLESLTVPAGVKTIGAAAFASCDSLADVTLQSEELEIAADAFDDTPWLTEKTFLVVGGVLVRYAGTAAAVTVPEGVTSVGSRAFQNCTAVTSVTIPAGVTSVGTYAFYGCTALEIVTADGTVTDIGRYAFTNTPWLENQGAFAVLNGTLAVYQGTDTAVTLPDTVEAVAGYAFYGRTAVTSLFLPETVTRLCGYAFYGAANLTKLAFRGNAPVIEDNAFFGLDILACYYSDKTGFDENTMLSYGGSAAWAAASGTCGEGLSWRLTEGWTLTVSGSGAMTAYGSLTAVPWNDVRAAIEAVDIGSKATSVAAYAFANCTALTAAVIPMGVTSIGSYAFYGCTALETVTAEGTVTDIGRYAFTGTPWLENQGAFAVLNGTLAVYQGPDTAVTLPDTVRVISSYAFYKNTSLASVTLPAGVTAIKGYAFYSCTALETVTAEGTVTDIGRYAFTDTPWLKNQGAFAVLNGTLVVYQGTDTEVTLPDAVRVINGYAFYGNTSLASVTLPDGLVSIGNYAFRGCTALTGITVPGSVKTVGDYAFRACTGLRSVTFAEGLESVGYAAFYQCTGLTALTAPGSAVSLGGFAFGGCTALAEITFLGDAPEIGDNCFYKVTASAGYYEDAEGWDTARKGYGGTLTWSARGRRYASLTSADGKVALRRDADAGAWDGDASVSITAAALESGASLPWTAENAPRRYAVYDVSLTGGTLAGAVKVCIKAPLDFGENCRVYRVEEDGSYTDMKARWLDGVIVFTTDHLSLYIIAQEQVGTLSTGDANADGRVNITDAMTIVRAAVALISLDGKEDQRAAADVTGEGEITCLDAVVVAGYAVGSVSRFPKDAAAGS